MMGPILVFIWLGISSLAIYNLDQTWAKIVFVINPVLILVPMLLAQRYRIDDD